MYACDCVHVCMHANILTRLNEVYIYMFYVFLMSELLGYLLYLTIGCIPVQGLYHIPVFHVLLTYQIECSYIKKISNFNPRCLIMLLQA